MSKRIGIVLALVVAVVVVVFLVSGSDDNDGYRVRAVFDNGGFMVNGEQVRIAGANVGTIESVDVTMPGETVGYDDAGKPIDKPGKAVIVMEISDPGFQDFRSDATCEIRPQSLIGEKFVDCTPTMQRAPGSKPPPLLKKVPDGQPGAGEYLLPLGNSSTSVDPDLINDIQTLPYAQRFRLILNELGAGLAGRGEDIAIAVRRANPFLRDVDRLVGILSDQRDRLAQLASDSDQVVAPLARERSHVAGFFSNAGAAAQASSEQGPALEASLRKLPQFLEEFRLTMNDFKTFSDAATPVVSDLGSSAPELTDATRTLGPFAEATTTALKSLGDAGEASGPLFRQAVPVVRKAGVLSRSGVVSTRELSALLNNIDETGGWKNLVELIYNGTGAVNGFDQYGHYGRTLITLTNCVDYIGGAGGSSGCTSRFSGPNAGEAGASSSAALYSLLARELAKKSGGTGTALAGPTTGLGAAAGVESAAQSGVAESSAAGGTEPLLDYLLGP